jgi:hypothetical protein
MLGELISFKNMLKTEKNLLERLERLGDVGNKPFCQDNKRMATST